MSKIPGDPERCAEAVGQDYIGKCLAELMTGGQATTVDLTPFRPTRFAKGQPWIHQDDYGSSLATICR